MVAILLLNVMKVLSVEVLCMIEPCMVFQRVCCACEPNVYLDAPSIGFVCTCRKLSAHLRV